MRQLAENRETARLAPLLNQIVSAIIGHRGEAGDSPFEPLNIERVVSSLRLLASRHQHEAAPFVRSWTPSLEDADRRSVRTDTARTLANGLDRVLLSGFAGGDAQVTAALTRAVHEATRPAGGEIFAELEREVVKLVADRLRQVKTVDYLKPLAQLASDQTVLDIATLNYDLTVETLAQDGGVELSRGVDNRQGGALTWSDEGINLYKIHGSVDWWIREDPYRTEPTRVGTETLIVSAEEPAEAHRHRAAIVLGDREKLEALSITLELMYDFAVSLRRCRRLIVVGYGFGDLHINRLIADWLDGDKSRNVTVLDPYWNPPPAWQSPLPQSFPARLATVMAAHNERGLRGHVVRQGTKDGLPSAIDQWPDDPAGRSTELTITYPNDEHAVLVELYLALDDRVQTVALQVGVPDAFSNTELGITISDSLECALVSPPPVEPMPTPLLLDRIQPSSEVHNEELSRLMASLKDGKPVTFKVLNRRRARALQPGNDLAVYDDLANFDLLVTVGYLAGFGRRVHAVRDGQLCVTPG